MPTFPALRGDRYTDVLIIGGGLCGLLTAYRLQQEGVNSLMLIEADELCGGTSAHTTAKITAQHGLIYAKLLKTLGAERAAGYAEANLRAISQYAALAERFSFGFRPCDAVAYAAAPKRLSALEEELRATERLGLPVRYAPPSSLTELPFRAAGGLRFPRQACMQPLALAAALTDALAAGGASIYTHTPALAHGGGRVFTPNGRIAARVIILATQFPFMDKSGFYYARLWQQRSYLVALPNTPPLKNIYWGADEGAAVTTLRGYDGGVILGGGAHKVGHETDRAHYARLLRAARRLYPQAWTGREIDGAPQSGRLPTADPTDAVSASLPTYPHQSKCANYAPQAWAAQDCLTHDGVPVIGRYAALDDALGGRVYLASGFGKWGMTGSMIAADIFAAALAGRAHPQAALFSPSRAALSAKAKSFSVQNLDMVGSYVGGLLRPVTRTAASLKRGEGAIVQLGGHRRGAYRDENGRLHVIKPYCGHMGCPLRFNAEEKTWDCPCHGSRYDVDGHVLHDPAPAAGKRSR